MSDDHLSSTPRVALVTGGTDGIGREVALALAGSGDRVLITGRDPAKGREVLSGLLERGPGVDHRFLAADLSLLGETDRLADDVLHGTERVDAVVCCAGLLTTVPEWTEEGLERTLVLNYLSRYALLRRLLPRLTEAPSGRVVLVANAGRYRDTLDLDDLQLRHGRPGLRVSGRTQFACDLLAVELAERLRGTRVEVTCVYPGVVKTSLFDHATGLPRLARVLAPPLVARFGLSPEAAADTPVWLAHAPDAVGTGGQFFGPHRKPITIPRRVRRSDRRRDLWQVSEDLVTAAGRPEPSAGARRGHSPG